jgi:hypothetical protein
MRDAVKFLLHDGVGHLRSPGGFTVESSTNDWF